MFECLSWRSPHHHRTPVPTIKFRVRDYHHHQWSSQRMLYFPCKLLLQWFAPTTSDCHGCITVRTRNIFVHDAAFSVGSSRCKRYFVRNNSTWSKHLPCGCLQYGTSFRQELDFEQKWWGMCVIFEGPWADLVARHRQYSCWGWKLALISFDNYVHRWCCWKAKNCFLYGYVLLLKGNRHPNNSSVHNVVATRVASQMFDKLWFVCFVFQKRGFGSKKLRLSAIEKKKTCVFLFSPLEQPGSSIEKNVEYHQWRVKFWIKT